MVLREKTQGLKRKHRGLLIMKGNSIISSYIQVCDQARDGDYSIEVKLSKKPCQYAFKLSSEKLVR